MVLFGQVINIRYIQRNQYCIKMLEMRWKDKKMFDPLQQKPIDEDHDASY